MPKSFAIWRSGASPLRATAITSRRNSGGNGLGTMLILPARPEASQVRSQPNRGQNQESLDELRSLVTAVGCRRTYADELVDELMDLLSDVVA